MSSPRFGLNADFNEPQSTDPTSAPPETVPQPVQPNPVASALGKRKKKAVRNPGALAGAIARAKRARQFGQRWG